ncbi:MAG: hypothetical protein ACP5VR_07815 [Acidimicrobiales bacterium]
MPADRATAWGAHVKVNSHVHLPPNFSAFSSVAEATELAAAQGVGVLGANNYYDYATYEQFAQLCLGRGIFPLFGTEVVCLDSGLQAAKVRVNDPANPGKVYLCGKGITRFDPMDAKANSLMAPVRLSDSVRTAAIIERLNEVFSARGVAMSLSEGSVKALVAQRYRVPVESVYLQERHVAMAFQEALFEMFSPSKRASALGAVLQVELSKELAAVEAQDAIRSQLMKAGKPGYVKENFVSFDHAYQLVLALGGVPCYPVLADGAKPVCEFEQDVPGLVRALKERRIYCAEVVPNRNDPSTLQEYVAALRSAGLPVLAGTEHNTLEMLPLEPRCADGVPLPADVRDIAWEGACVIAAHQYLAANGQGGYVGSEGNLDDRYQDDEARIESYARLGAAVIEKYAKLATSKAQGEV